MAELQAALRHMSTQQRLAIVLSHPTQYYSPWFQWMQANTTLTFRVFYLWDFGVTQQTDPLFGRAVKWDTDLLSGYEHEFMPNVARDPGTHHFRGLDNPTLPMRLRLWKPDAVLVFGYKYLTHMRLIMRAPCPLIFRGDSHLIGQPRPVWLKRTLLRLVYSRFAAVTFVGAANRSYFEAFGVPVDRLFFAPHCVNDRHFVPTDVHVAECRRIRGQLGIGTRRVVLFAGKLVPAKQPMELLRAFLALAAQDAALVFVGDGSERPALETMAAANPKAMVRFLPFANQSEMPSRYLLADVFALPSRGYYETWGLAVNEAMHMGIPCLVSDQVGCQRDLVTDGETGWVFRCEKPDDLRLTLDRALRDYSAKGDVIRANVAHRISGYTYSRATAGLEKALASIVTAG